MLDIQCPACKTEYELDASFLNRKVVCHQCQQRFLITSDGALIEEVGLEMELTHDSANRETAASESMNDAADEQAMQRPMPRRRPSRRPQKSIAMPVIVISLTVFVVLGVVILSVYMIIRGFSDEKEPGKNKLASFATMPDNHNPNTQQRQGPDLGDMGNRPTNFELKDLNTSDSQFLILKPNGPVITAADLPVREPTKAQFPAAKIKESTVFIRVDRENGASTGSGFFAFEPGLVVTNAHVVGMMRPSDKAPQNVDVVINSGETNEKRLKADVIAVDRIHDLAILKVRGNPLPPPMPILSSTQLVETQPVTVAGFPLATQIGKNISLRQATVSSLRKEDGRLTTVQVSGGMNPGNSGGPVIDQDGRVVGVSVSILGNRPDFTESSNTDFCFAVPTDYVYDLYYGTVQSLIILPCSVGEKGLSIPIQVRLNDALNRIKTVSLEWWIGNPGDSIPGSLKNPSEQSQRPEVQTLVLNTQRIGTGKSIAEGELNVPTLAQGKALWIQPKIEYQSATGPVNRWYSAHSIQFASPFISKSSVKSPPKKDILDVWELSHYFQTRIRSEHGEYNFSPVKISIQDKWRDIEPAPTGVRHVRKITAFNVGAQVKGEPLNYQTLVALLMNSGGGGSTNGSDFSSLKQHEQFLFGSLCHLPNSMQEWDFSLPTGAIEVDQRWKKTIKLPLLFALGRAEIQNLEVQCRYLGKTKINDIEVAIIGLHSDFVPTSAMPATGSLIGLAHIDLDTGHLNYLYGTMELEVEKANLSAAVSGGMGVIQSSLVGKLEFRIVRTPVPE